MVSSWVISVLAVVAVWSIAAADIRSRRRHHLPGQRPGLSPLRRFIRKSTHDSLELDMLVTPGLDPCQMNDSVIVVENKAIGELKNSMIFGLRGFDNFRQQFNIQKRLVRSTLAFKFLEGAGEVTLKNADKTEKKFKLNVIAEMLLVIKSKLIFDDHAVQFSDSLLHESIEPTVQLFPSKPISRHLLNQIGKSFVIHAEDCIRKKFVPAFESGVNRALVAKNITKVINEFRKKPSTIHEFFRKATNNASKKVQKHILNLQLPNIELGKLHHETNLTEGQVAHISEPKLYFYNAAEQKNTYNLQLLIRKLVVQYKMNRRPFSYAFSNLQFFISIKPEPKAKKFEIIKAIIIGVEMPRPPRPLPLLLEINSKMYAMLMNFVEPKLKTAFMKTFNVKFVPDFFA